MQPEEIVAALNGYSSELEAILSRFTHSRERISIKLEDNYRVRALVTELIDLLRDHVPGSAQHIRLIADSYNEDISNFTHSSSFASVQNIRGIASAVVTRIERNPRLFAEAVSPVGGGPDQRKLLDALDQLVLRFDAVVNQLRSRHADRPTLDVNDEYDVQDLMHALLRLYFDDVRPEEWVPSYAGSASRTDFLLPQVDTHTYRRLLAGHRRSNRPSGGRHCSFQRNHIPVGRSWPDDQPMPPGVTRTKAGTTSANGMRVVCNPKGCIGRNGRYENRAFRAAFVVDLDWPFKCTL